MLRFRRKTATLARLRPTFTFNCEVNTVWRKWKSPMLVCASWTLESAKKRSFSRWACKNKSLMNLQCNLPDVLTTTAGEGVADFYLQLWREHRVVEVERSTVGLRKLNSWICKKRSFSRWVCKNNSLMNSLCNLPDVLVIAVIFPNASGSRVVSGRSENVWVFDSL
jgi:hypothetical protein